MIRGSEWRPDRAEQTIHDALGDEQWQGIERIRAKHSSQYRTSPENVGRDVLDYTYLGQVGQLMMWKKAWDLFSALFRDRRQLEDLINGISPVRNERAHFRSVPILELRRCQVACEDLRARLAKDSGA